MSRNFTLGQLTEGIRDRNVGQDGGRLINKWTRTGLLRGLNEHKRENMARLLENQAAQVLREANTLAGGAGGNIDGFTNIAFPIVRRVFGGLVANELVSIQPMSLPSGLLFYLDYAYGSDVGGEEAGAGNAELDAQTAAVYAKGNSLYGSPSGNSIQGGADAAGGMYDLAGSSYSKVHKTLVSEANNLTAADHVRLYDGTASVGSFVNGTWTADTNIDITDSTNLKLLGYDPQLVKEISENSTAFRFMILEAGSLADVDKSMIKSAGLMLADGQTFGSAAATAVTTDSDNVRYQDGKNIYNLRRLNQVGDWDGSTWKSSVSGDEVLLVVQTSSTSANWETDFAAADLAVTYSVAEEAIAAGGGAGSTIVVPSFESNFAAAGPTPVIPEIDIKIESIAVTAQTRKLRARWSPELAQDLNAYHSLDAEVELTQILSEQIALEIDREILNDLLVEAKGANFFWSRAPGKFVNKRSGVAQNLASTLATGPQFTGTVREWYETLVETIIDVANEIHRKTLRGAANFIVVSPEVATIFEASVLYKPSIKIDGQGQVAAPFSLGAEAIGSLSNRFTVYKDPYFPRNKILVGYKGGSYLESGYVYAPYVPLIVTPTIFAPEDFTPRKGVMTRYGKKMVRADFYGTVTCLDMDVI